MLENRNEVMSPTIDIIVPVYNVRPYLRRCLDSIAAQTHKQWRALCIDDGSTDGSGVMLDDYAAHDPILRGRGELVE